jgi:hypothetical protein
VRYLDSAVTSLAAVAGPPPSLATLAWPSDGVGDDDGNGDGVGGGDGDGDKIVIVMVMVLVMAMRMPSAVVF